MEKLYPNIRGCIHDEVLTDGVNLRGNDGEFDEEKVKIFLGWIVEDALNPDRYLARFRHLYYNDENAMRYLARARFWLD